MFVIRPQGDIDLGDTSSSSSIHIKHHRVYKVMETSLEYKYLKTVYKIFALLSILIIITIVMLLIIQGVQVIQSYSTIQNEVLIQIAALDISSLLARSLASFIQIQRVTSIPSSNVLLRARALELIDETTLILSDIHERNVELVQDIQNFD